MDDPNYLSPTAAEEARVVAAQVIAQETDEDTYWRGIDMLSLIGRHLPDDAPGRLYVLWGELTDIWDLYVERRPESVALMRDAASEFLALDDYATGLDAYLTRWYERLGAT